VQEKRENILWIVISLLAGTAGTLFALWRGAKARGDAKALRETLRRYEYAAGKADEAFNNVSTELELTRKELATQIERRETIIANLKKDLRDAEALIDRCAIPGVVRDELQELFSGKTES
jgi:hypothetical protein